MPVMAEALTHDIEYNPTSPHNHYDPFIFSRPDS
jgi:hypothetical protein